MECKSDDDVLKMKVGDGANLVVRTCDDRAALVFNQRFVVTSIVEKDGGVWLTATTADGVGVLTIIGQDKCINSICHEHIHTDVCGDTARLFMESTDANYMNVDCPSESFDATFY